MTQGDLQSVFSHPERPHRSVLSVYLNVDQSLQSNWNRGFEKQLKNLTSSLRITIHDASELEQFTAAARHVEDFVSAYKPGARGLVVFFDGLDGFFWHQELAVPLHSQARWDRTLFVQPLANVLDQFEGYGVVLVDRFRLRLFTVFLSEIEEFSREEFEPDAWLQRVTKDVAWLVHTKKASRLVLAGASDTTSELHGMLPKHLALRVIGAVDVAIDAAAHEVLAATLPIAEEYERGIEVQTVKEIVRGRALNEKTVAGLGRTLKAVNANRIWELIYSEGFTSPGFECMKCAAVFSLEKTSCPYCGATVQPISDVVERAVDHSLRQGAKVEVVTGQAAASLNSLGGIAAVLKTRTIAR